MKGNEFVFDFDDEMCNKFHKTSLNCGGSFIDSPNWIENEGATIDPKNNDNRCFQFPVTIALNHERSRVHPERIAKIMPFIH